MVPLLWPLSSQPLPPPTPPWPSSKHVWMGWTYPRPGSSGTGPCCTTSVPCCNALATWLLWYGGSSWMKQGTPTILTLHACMLVLADLRGGRLRRCGPGPHCEGGRHRLGHPRRLGAGDGGTGLAQLAMHTYAHCVVLQERSSDEYSDITQAVSLRHM